MTNIICDVAAAVCRGLFPSQTFTLLLTGSLARDEGSFIEGVDEWEVLGDADFLLVLERGVEWAERQQESLLRGIESALAEHRIRCRLGVGVVSPRYLRSLSPHIFGYELRECGRVIHGTPDVLSLIPQFSFLDIPHQDGFQLLCNRMLEHVASIADGGSLPDRLSFSARYSTVKLFLDMAASLLLFNGIYKPTYRERLIELRRLTDLAKNTPFCLAEFTHLVDTCTRLKLDATSPSEYSVISTEMWRQAITHGNALWQWELLQLSSRLGGVSARCRKGYGWIRGWAHVLRAQGWHRSWRNWLRWSTLSLSGSPRDLIYNSGVLLFCALPRLVSGPIRNHEWQALNTLLPLREPISQTKDAWRQLAHNVYRNYEQLLVNTRN